MWPQQLQSTATSSKTPHPESGPWSPPTYRPVPTLLGSIGSQTSRSPRATDAPLRALRLQESATGCLWLSVLFALGHCPLPPRLRDWLYLLRRPRALVGVPSGSPLALHWDGILLPSWGLKPGQQVWGPSKVTGLLKGRGPTYICSLHPTPAVTSCSTRDPRTRGHGGGARGAPGCPAPRPAHAGSRNPFQWCSDFGQTF